MDDKQDSKQDNQKDQVDLYRILGLTRDATQQDIRRAYKKLAQQYHPDKNKDEPKAGRLFKEIKFAYEVLSNPDKRARYDRGDGVDSQPKLTREQKIKQLAVELFLNNIMRSNPIQMSRNVIKQGIEGNKLEINKNEGQIKKLQKAKDKLIFKSQDMDNQDDPFIMAIESTISQLKYTNEKLGQDIELGNDLLNFLSNYEWKAEEPAIMRVGSLEDMLHSNKHRQPLDPGRFFDDKA